jgi:hypothetical protein
MRYEYENLVNMFENSLLTELRGHGASGEFLRSWVPDTDAAKSLINMADAAGLENVAAFQVDIAAQTLPASGVAEIADALKGAFKVTSVAGGTGRMLLTFTSETAR